MPSIVSSCRCVNTSAPKSPSDGHILYSLVQSISILYNLKNLIQVISSSFGPYILRLTERPEQDTQFCFNSWVVLSRTVQPENGDFKLNLRFVSPWNANSPSTEYEKKPQTPVWTVAKYVFVFKQQGFQFSVD